jgi:hypothetical protein
MRVVLLVIAVALGIDAYAYSGFYTQATVREASHTIQRLVGDIRTESEPPAPPRPIPDRPSPTS